MWYARRASLATIYGAAGTACSSMFLEGDSPKICDIELHQLASPETAYGFLGQLLETSSALKKSLDEVGLFASYVGNSWAGIIRSRSIF